MPVFKLYGCKLRLGGSVLNEVRKDDVTAAEIEMYRALHGSDAVLEIKATGEVKYSDREERERIVSIFANPAKVTAEALKKKMLMIRDAFGHDRNPMPKELDDVAETDLDDEDETEVEVQAEAPVVEPPKRTRVKPQTAAEADFAV